MDNLLDHLGMYEYLALYHLIHTREVLQNSLVNGRRTKPIHALSQWHKESDMSNTELLQAILSKIEGLEKALAQKEQYRIGPKEFANRMNISERTFWPHINDGVIKNLLKMAQNDTG